MAEKKTLGKILSLFLISFLIFSCESTDKKTGLNGLTVESDDSSLNVNQNPQKDKSYHNVTYLNELLGKWKSSKSEYEYPFFVDGKRYLRYALKFHDDTSLWMSYAEINAMDFSDLWKKRFVYAPYIYQENYPASDKNGTEVGRKFLEKNNRIYSRIEYLIPESVLLANLNYFYMCDDGLSFFEKGTFNLASEKFFPLLSDIEEYVKTGDLHL